MSTTDSALWSLIFNSLAFVIFSLLQPQQEDEREVANACFREGFLLPQGALHATSIAEFEQQLKKIIGADIARNEIDRALADLGISEHNVDRDTLTMLRAQINRNLSGLVGPVLSRMIVNEHLQIDLATKSALADTIQFVEHSQEKTRSELKGVSSELDSLRRFHFQVLQDLPLGVVSISHDLGIVSWNKALEKITATVQENVIGQSIEQLDNPWRDMLLSFVNSEDSQIIKLKVNFNGDLLILNLFKAIVSQNQDSDSGTAILIEDHSKRYSLEEKLAHSERLASIGQLATGIAHEIGNPVTGIACLAQDIQADIAYPEQVKNGLRQILTQTERITNIVSSLVDFSHVGAPLDHPTEPVLLRSVVGEAINLVSLSHDGKGLAYENNCAESIQVQGFPQKLVQVFVNLLSNATDASAQGQTITINAETTDNRALIRVRDFGEGISEEHLPRIFEPFFTTKMVGTGTGLGLSLTYSIIQEHTGTISVESWAGAGSQFEISLPLVNQHELD
ncbi:MAG: GHKL domain-containing protein [Aestuariibacter sp.]|nr:GHKL domain-containing protein [Aestuariibacter sp.]